MPYRRVHWWPLRGSHLLDPRWWFPPRQRMLRSHPLPLQCHWFLPRWMAKQPFSKERPLPPPLFRKLKCHWTGIGVRGVGRVCTSRRVVVLIMPSSSRTPG